MVLTALVNAAAMPVLAFCVVRIQFTFYSKYDGNEDWESEATQWLIIVCVWIFVIQVISKGLEKGIFSAMGEKMTLKVRI